MQKMHTYTLSLSLSPLSLSLSLFPHVCVNLTDKLYKDNHREQKQEKVWLSAIFSPLHFLGLFFVRFFKRGSLRGHKMVHYQRGAIYVSLWCLDCNTHFLFLVQLFLWFGCHLCNRTQAITINGLQTTTINELQTITINELQFFLLWQHYEWATGSNQKWATVLPPVSPP